MADNFWIGGAAAVAQVNSVTVATVAGGDDVLTITLSDDAGNSHAVTSTNPASASAGVAALVAAAVAAKAAGNRPWTAVTAADADPIVTITADTAGTRFYVATTATGGASLTDAATTANSGPSDFLCAENWSLGAIPVATNRLVFPRTVTGSVLYGLKEQSGSPAYLGIVVEEDCMLVIGHARQPLVVTLTNSATNEVRLAGRGQKFIQLKNGYAGDAIYIDESAGDVGGLPGTVFSDGTGTTIDYAVYVKIASGQSVGFAVTENTVMKIDAIKLDGGGTIILGDGVTDTPNPTVIAGVLETHCALTTVTFGGSKWTHYEGTATTINMIGTGQTTLLSEDLAAATVLNLYGPARVAFGPRAGVAQFTVMDVYGTRWQIDDPFGRVLQYEMNHCSPADGRLAGPKNMEWDVSAIA